MKAYVITAWKASNEVILVGLLGLTLLLFLAGCGKSAYVGVWKSEGGGLLAPTMTLSLHSNGTMDLTASTGLLGNVVEPQKGHWRVADKKLSLTIDQGKMAGSDTWTIVGVTPTKLDVRMEDNTELTFNRVGDE